MRHRIADTNSDLRDSIWRIDEPDGEDNIGVLRVGYECIAAQVLMAE